MSHLVVESSAPVEPGNQIEHLTGQSTVPTELPAPVFGRVVEEIGTRDNLSEYSSGHSEVVIRRRRRHSDTFSESSGSLGSSHLEPYFTRPPLPNGQLIHEILWERLHDPPFLPGALTPDVIIHPQKYDFLWKPRKLWVFWHVILPGLTHPGCARNPVMSMLKEASETLNDCPEVHKVGWRENGDKWSRSPEMRLRSRFGWKWPKRSRWPKDEESRPVDVDNRPVSHKLTDMHGSVDPEFEKCYLVIGVFVRGNRQPHERLVKIKESRDFFKILRREVGRLRPWRRFFSLKGLKSFGLYRCDLDHYNSHDRFRLGEENRRVMDALLEAYESDSNFFVKNSTGWAEWVCENLNDSCHNPKKSRKDGGYSLECHFDWSETRITIAIITPLIISFAVGIVYQQVYQDVQTAWTIAAYIVTTATAFVALLALTSQLAGF